jgi:hypothetical protein
MIENDYGIKRKGTSVQNPQANKCNLGKSTSNYWEYYLDISKENLDEENLKGGILAATMFAVRATYHKAMQATPTQLVFERDSIKYQI